MFKCYFMLSINGIRNACPRCSCYSLISFRRKVSYTSFATRPHIQHGRGSVNGYSFSTSRTLRQDGLLATEATPTSDVEKVVRDAKQRFRDTLPKGYLNDQEYALYERLYGPPLRETEPEDVGIPMHADMGHALPRPNNEGTLLRQLDGGEFEEVTYKIARQEIRDEPDRDLEDALAEVAAEDMVEKAPGYVDAVARSQREHDALQKLVRDFEAAQKKHKDGEDAAAAQEGGELEMEEPPYWLPEEEYEPGERGSGEARRFHRYTIEGRFHGSPVEIALPREEFVEPLRELLDRSHPKHVKDAAEAAFGGEGLPTSPATPEGLKNGRMGGVGLPPDQRHMTEIEADAFLAGYLPPAYASVMSILREVRKRVGGEWLQSRLKQGREGGLSVLDAGAGGAALVAWEQILNAEWEVLKEKGEVKGTRPPGKKTAIAASDRLRHRIKTFLDNTTFLPRLPDYEHSGEMQGEHLDAGHKPQQRKSFDVIIASHLFLKEEQEHYRQAVLNKLWSLLNKDGGILIVVEKAHPRGFEAVAQVRDSILKQFLLPRSGEQSVSPEDFNPAFHRELEPGHIVAPCTNHDVCPMYKEPGKSKGRKDYCHFSQRFVQPTFYSKMLGKSTDNRGDVEFSYVVIRRGVPKRSSVSGREATERALQGYEASEEQPDMQALPRMVLPPLKRKGHVTLDLCTPEGRIERWTVPKSFSKLAYHDARKSRWGDLWALGAKTRVPRSVRVGSGVDDGGKRAADGKKARKVEISMDGGRLSANEKHAPMDRRTKSKDAKKRDLIKELFAAEEREEAMIEREMDEEEEAELGERRRETER
ncbi:Rsm22-cox11 tandem protein 1, mitochondrial [Tolypocladium capitatum]|uniref:Rsm22-cox11 tandem protein 1, mitochondrial n=1 Tax=Tolypocladium capitatum TaxID=45235 RepID=A0A2K3QNI7_9HYPO|nr:Rsm22-cox11 tandem protein 1, mitochondrial [Tolypocladium capitatum]